MRSSPSIILAGSLFLSVIGISISNSCNLEVNLIQELLNEGFHRSLTYSVFLKENGVGTETYDGCHIGVEQSLPAGVFANPDELSDLKRVGRVHTILSSPVNVELPFEQSRPITAISFGTVNGARAALWLPVHARYRGAVAGGGFATNDLPSPRVYLRCGRRLSLCPAAVLQPATRPCAEETSELCQWDQMRYSMVRPTPAWKVPVGNTSDYYIVASGTALAVIFGSLYILKSMHDYKLRSKKRAP